jgi:hypothetical protein
MTTTIFLFGLAAILAGAYLAWGVPGTLITAGAVLCTGAVATAAREDGA